MSARPWWRSGSGRSQGASSANSSTRSVSSPRRLEIASPATPMTSPSCVSQNAAKSSSPVSSSLASSCSLPLRSSRSTNARLPCTRRAIGRPASRKRSPDAAPAARSPCARRTAAISLRSAKRWGSWSSERLSLTSRRNGDVDDLELEHAGRHAHLDRLALLLAHQRAADGGLVGEPARGRVGLGRADDPVGRVALAVDVLDRDLEADADGADVRVGRIDDARGAQALLELRDLLLEQHLLVLRVVELRVLGDVAEFAGNANAVGDFATLVGRQLLQLLLQLLVPLLSEQDVSLHDASIGPGRPVAAGKTSSGRTKHMRLDGANVQRTLGWTVQSTTLHPGATELSSPFHIGTVEIGSRVVLAPMAGVSVQAFRRQGRRFGGGPVCSAVVSARGPS